MTDEWHRIEDGDPEERESMTFAVVVEFKCRCYPDRSRTVMTAARADGVWLLNTEHDVDITHWCRLAPMPPRAVPREMMN